MRAAVRACDRLLPMLEPGFSARRGSLPPGGSLTILSDVEGQQVSRAV